MYAPDLKKFDKKDHFFAGKITTNMYKSIANFLATTSQMGIKSSVLQHINKCSNFQKIIFWRVPAYNHPLSESTYILTI